MNNTQQKIHTSKITLGLSEIIKNIGIKIFIFTSIFLMLWAQLPCIHANAEELQFDPQVTIPGFSVANQEKDINENSIGELIKAIYTYAIGLVGILATAVMIFGGLLYITAAGNAGKMDNAKAWIGAALTGLVLALFSYTILYIVNPNLVSFKSLKVQKADRFGINGCCSWEYSKSMSEINQYSEKGCKTITDIECEKISGGKFMPRGFCFNNKCYPLTAGCGQFSDQDKHMYCISYCKKIDYRTGSCDEGQCKCTK